MKNIRISLLENIHPIAEDILKQQGFFVDRYSSAYNGDELVDLLQQTDVVGIRSKTKLTSEVLKKLPNLKLIGAFCIGTNQIDLGYTKKNAIPVFNSPYSNTRSVAELVIAEIISLARKMPHISALAHKGVWQKSASGSFEVRGKKLGIVGYGHIGSQLSILAEAIGLDVYYYDILKKLPLGNATEISSLKELLQTVDFVSFHVPETEETKLMIRQEQLDWMKPNSYLINASRGSVVAIPDLVEALKSKKLAGAAIDVFPTEPANNDEEFLSDLRGIDNVILTPHIGGSTEEAQFSIGGEVSKSLIQFLNEGQTNGAVSFPNIDIPQIKPGQSRILSAHKNQPGVLSAINSFVSEQELNITNQRLSTNEDVGYLALDIDGDTSDLVDKISKQSWALWTRHV